MIDLREFATLQARVWEFTAQLDDATQRGIVNGTIRLTTEPAVDGPTPAGLTGAAAAKLSVRDLRKLAKQRGLTGYSKLARAELTNLLIRHGADQTEQPAPVREERPPEPNGEAAAIAARLREIETEEEGAEYLHAQHLDREGLLAVAAELLLTRVNRLSQKELRKRVLEQAIGARRKFAGLRKW